MKNCTPGWLVAAVLSCCLCAENASAGLVTHLTFDSSAGSINGIGGVYQGNAQLTGGGGGVSGEALLLDGNGDYVSFAHGTAGSPVLGPLTSVSVSMWVNTSVNNNTFDRLFAVFRHNEDDFRFGNFEVGASQGSSNRFGFEAADLLAGNTFNVGTAFTLNQWNHLTAVVDQDANVVRLYLNGTLGNSAGIVASDFTFNDNDRVFIGAGNNPSFFGGIAHFFNGRIDDVQVYDSALTAEDIAFLRNNPGSTLGAAVPEPSSLALLGMGGVALMGLSYRRRRALRGQALRK